MLNNPSFKDNQLTPHLALIAVQLMFGTWPLVGKIVLKSLSSTSLVGFRILGAAIVFAILQRKVGQLFRLPKRVIGWLLLSSVLGVVINQLIFVKGLSFTTAINATLLTTTVPVFILLVSIAFGYDRASLRHVLGIALAASGVVYLVDPWRADFTAQTTLGKYSDHNELIFLRSLHLRLQRSLPAIRRPECDHLDLFTGHTGYAPVCRIRVEWRRLARRFLWSVAGRFLRNSGADCRRLLSKLMGNHARPAERRRDLHLPAAATRVWTRALSAR